MNIPTTQIFELKNEIVFFSLVFLVIFFIPFSNPFEASAALVICGETRKSNNKKQHGKKGNVKHMTGN